MKRKLTTLALLAAFVLVLGGAWLLYQNLGGTAGPGLAAADSSASGTPQSSAAPGGEAAAATGEGGAEEPRTEAPDFTVYDADGSAVKLSDLEGKPVILNFWASWCGPCKSEMPDFEEACAQYGGDIHFMMVNSTDGSRETVDTASAYLADNGYTFPAYFDTDFEASTAYGVTGLPTTFFIDSEGYLVAYARGALNAETLQTGIDMLLPQE